MSSASPNALLPRLPGRAILFPSGGCIGRNYEAHAREMGKDPNRDAPFFFNKWADALVANGSTVPYPPETANCHFEAELVIAIGKEGARRPRSRRSSWCSAMQSVST